MLDRLDPHTFKLHPQRDVVLNEVHARPFMQLVPPFKVIHYAFLAKDDAAQAIAAASSHFVGIATFPHRGPQRNITRLLSDP
ncbi:putative membrane-anchored protein [Bradyrhizobium sp. USDA 4473]